MVITLALAVVLSQSAPAPEDQISGHVISNIRSALRTSSSVALVTVRSASADRVQLDVNDAVVGTFPSELDVTARAFNRHDVEPGTQLLVFFRGNGAARVPTGHYELAIDGKIREYSVESYLARTRYEGARIVKAKPEPKPAPAAPSNASLSAAGAIPPAGS